MPSTTKVAKYRFLWALWSLLDWRAWDCGVCYSLLLAGILAERQVRIRGQVGSPLAISNPLPQRRNRWERRSEHFRRFDGGVGPEKSRISMKLGKYEVPLLLTTSASALDGITVASTASRHDGWLLNLLSPVNKLGITLRYGDT